MTIEMEDDGRKSLVVSSIGVMETALLKGCLLRNIKVTQRKISRANENEDLRIIENILKQAQTISGAITALRKSYQLR